MTAREKKSNCRRYLEEDISEAVLQLIAPEPFYDRKDVALKAAKVSINYLWQGRFKHSSYLEERIANAMLEDMRISHCQKLGFEATITGMALIAMEMLRRDKFEKGGT